MQNKKRNKKREALRDIQLEELLVDEEGIFDDEDADTVTDDTLEFLSLDDDMIEAYNRSHSVSGSKNGVVREYEDDDEYGDEEYEDEEDDEYGDEEYEDEDDEYGDEEYEDEDDEYGDEDYEDEEDDEYGDEEYEDEDDEYGDEDYEDEDDEYEDYEYDAYARDSAFVRFKDFLGNMSSLDMVVAMLGIVVLVGVFVTGSLYVGARMTQKQVEAFASVGEQIEGISVIGEGGLIAVSESAKLTNMFEVEEEEQEQEQEEEADEKEDIIEVSLRLTSIQSDLKIKFVNQKTGKLIGGVPFEVEVVSGKKTYNLKDEDKDGIIYQTEIESGSYQVTIKPFTGNDYQEYKLPAKASTVEVTDQIAYKKVDVVDEVKTEAEVNAAVEDTAQQNTVVESTLTDTVEWVESTKKEIDSDDNYQEIKKSDIVDPATVSQAIGFVKMVSENDLPTTPQLTDEEKLSKIAPSMNSSVELKKGHTATINVSVSSQEYSYSVDWSSSNGSVASVSGGTITGNAAGSAEITATVKVGNASKSLKCTVNVTEDAPTYEIANISGDSSIMVGGTGKVSGTTSPAGGTITWSSTNTKIVTVDGSGNLKGIAAGQAAITGTCGNTTKTLNVTVVEATAKYTKVVITGNSTVQVGKTETLKGSTEPAGGQITWKSDNEKIAKVDSKGNVTGVAVGKTNITGTCGNAKGTLEINVVNQYTELKVTGDETIQVGKTGKVVGKTTPEGGKITWTSDNEKIAKVDANGTVTGVAVGTATITGTCEGVKGTLKVTVKKDLSGDKQTKLKDKKGRQIYIKNADGKYVEATYADYYLDQKFYLQKEKVKYSYTGWQTIDGNVYFYDKNGNVVTGEQVIQGAKYNFGSDGKLSSGSGSMGIDVSKWNGSIDWNAVKNSGVSYVIIRCGYRGSSTGALIEDPKFKSNIKGAKAAGLKVGVYFFSQAVNEVEAVEEASMAVSLASGYGLNYPIFLDVEGSGGRGDAISKETRTAVCKAFCTTVQNSGCSAGIYANKTWFTEKINTGSLTGYKIWLAQYASAPTYTATKYDMWQYSSKGKVSGISGNVDMNISYLNY